MNHTLFWTIGPANTAFASYTERVPLFVIAPAALSASLMLSACRLWLVPLANSVPLKRLPPSRGITLSTTPLLVVPWARRRLRLTAGDGAGAPADQCTADRPPASG